MQRLLLLLSTIVCTIAGWYLGTGRGSQLLPDPPEPARAVLSRSASSKPTPSQIQQRGEALRRLADEFRADYQNPEIFARMFAELENVPSTEMAPTIAMLRGLDFDRGVGQVGALLAGLWAERDPEAARQWVLGVQDFQLTVAVMDALGESDKPELFRWLDANADQLTKGVKNAAAFSLAKQQVSGSPEAALEIMEKISQRAGRGSTLFMFWANKQPQAAAEWALREPTDELRSKAITSVVQQWAGRDVEAARAWVEHLDDPILMDNALAMIGRRIGWDSPSKGADFLASLPQSNRVREALKDTLTERNSLFTGWTLDGSLGWSLGVEDQSLRDWAFQQVIEGVAPEQLDKAIAALPDEQKITAEQLRDDNRESPPTSTTRPSQ